MEIRRQGKVGELGCVEFLAGIRDVKDETVGGNQGRQTVHEETAV
jgi:hypothetical protein